MVLAPGKGKEGTLKVGASDNVVLGVRSMSIPKNWDTEEIMHLQDQAPTTLLNYQKWEIPLELTLDHADDGQALLFGAEENGTNIAFKAYIDNTHYWSGDAVVTKWEEKIDPGKTNTVSTSLKPSLGSALTYS